MANNNNNNNNRKKKKKKTKTMDTDTVMANISGVNGISCVKFNGDKI